LIPKSKENKEDWIGGDGEGLNEQGIRLSNTTPRGADPRKLLLGRRQRRGAYLLVLELFLLNDDDDETPRVSIPIYTPK
jgi:hypothetical protein